MIFVTGDTHIPIDIDKLREVNFPNQKTMTKQDYVIICGDFGGVWKKEEPEQPSWLNWLNSANFTALFIDGNHENFDLLNAYPVSQWKGGKVHFIRDNVIHLMRGQIYELEGQRFFAMGGANSIDKASRKQGFSWWEQEMPSEEEYEEAINNLEQYNFEVDIIISHTAPLSIIRHFYEPEDEYLLNLFLEKVKKKTTYKMWFFGHVHQDMEVDKKHTALYQNILQVC